MGITLGLDIGTQYCYAGYYDDNGKFQAAFDVSQDGADNGIPTDVAYHSSNRLLRFGYEAREVRENNNTGWRFLPLEDSLKTRMRRASDDSAIIAKFDNKSLTETIRDFLSCIVKNLKIGGNQIDEIRVAFPDTTSSGTQANAYSYAIKLQELVMGAFNLSKEKVLVKTESEYAADLLKRIFQHKNNGNPPTRFCTIDVGAGTTDISSARWDQENNRYKATFYGAVDFGGKNVDKIIQDITRRISDRTSDLQMLKYKRWLFETAGEPQSAEIFGFEKNQLKNAVESAIDKQIGDLSESIRSALRKASIFSDGGTIILMGGSSVLPFVSQKVQAIIAQSNNINIIRLTEIGSGFGVSNANFLAMAAASYGRNIKYNFATQGTTQRQTIQVATDNYSPFTYAVKVHNGDFEIIVRRGIHNGSIDVLSKEAFQQRDDRGRIVDFNPGRNIYRLDLKMDPKRDTIRSNEVSTYIRKKKELQSGDDFVNKTGVIAGSAGSNRFFKRRMKFDFSTGVGQQLIVSAEEVPQEPETVQTIGNRINNWLHKRR